VLARDAIGIKPLHVLRRGTRVAFASEIKSFYALPDFKPSLDRDALHLFLNFRYVPNEQTLFAGVERLEPGSVLVLDANGNAARHRFFSLRDVARREQVALGPLEDEVADALEESVKSHLVADVEVATYLSGGIDSSVVTACAARHSPGIRSFCVAFGEPSDENADARRVADLVGSKHEDIVVPDEVLEHMAEVMWHVEEPKVNALQGYLLANVVSKRVRVALSGLGGDELFAGYTNNDVLYPMTLLTRLLGPQQSRWSMSSVQRLFASSRFDLAFRAGELGLRARDPLGFYCVLRNAFDHNDTLLRRLYGTYPSHWRELTREALRPYYDANDRDVLSAVLLLEARTKLVNDFLLTEDRVSMANSLETRVPLLSRRLLTLAFGLPSRFRYRPGGTQWVMKRAARRWLPSDVLEKKKWGFSFNPYLLFQKTLRAFAARELTSKRVEELGFVRWDWIRDVLDAPASPSRRWHYFNLWALVGFSVWHRRFFETPVRAPAIPTRNGERALASGT
jgi:asparagine synthase (glutamine-hydrolysing)